MTHPNYVLYHADCLDGFGAAYIAAKWLMSVGEPYVLVPCKHGEPFPVSVPEEASVRVFDFSWKRDEMARVLSRYKDFKLFDHHATAEANLEGMPHCTFDMSRSGAQMAWSYYFGGDEPWWVAYIADRDLWKKELVGCDDVHAWMGSFPKTVDAWDRALDSRPDRAVLQDAMNEGRAINRVFKQMIWEHYQRARQREFWPARPEERGLPNEIKLAWTFCNEHRIVSELGVLLAESSPSKIGLCVFPNGNYSFRSTEDGPDVGALAAMFGGGGHKHSSGCTGDPLGLLSRK